MRKPATPVHPGYVYRNNDGGVSVKFTVPWELQRKFRHVETPGSLVVPATISGTAGDPFAASSKRMRETAPVEVDRWRVTTRDRLALASVEVETTKKESTEVRDAYNRYVRTDVTVTALPEEKWSDKPVFDYSKSYRYEVPMAHVHVKKS